MTNNIQSQLKINIRQTHKHIQLHISMYTKPNIQTKCKYNAALTDINISDQNNDLSIRIFAPVKRRLFC